MECLLFLIAIFALSLFLGRGPDLPNPEQYDDEYYGHDVSGLLEED